MSEVLVVVVALAGAIYVTHVTIYDTGLTDIGLTIGARPRLSAAEGPGMKNGEAGCRLPLPYVFLYPVRSAAPAHDRTCQGEDA